MLSRKGLSPGKSDGAQARPNQLQDAGSSFRALRQALDTSDEAGPFEQLVARAVARGELSDVRRSARVVNLAFDLYPHEIFVTMRAVADEDIVAIVDDVWLPLLGLHSPR